MNKNELSEDVIKFTKKKRLKCLEDETVYGGTYL